MKKSRAFYLPPIGQRIVKTAVAVTLCLLFYVLIGYRGDSIPAEAAITAIICMQPYVHDTTKSALSRLTGTLTGIFWGFVFLLLVMAFPAAAKHPVVLYVMMGLGTLFALHSAVLARRPDDAALAAIVFLCVVIAYPDIEDPLRQGALRVRDVLVGTTAAILVNTVRFPRKKRRDRVFFVHTADLLSDQLSEISPQVLFRLRYLFQDGARICLMSQHAPAFLLSQVGRGKMGTPMIVMDGAALYDADENAYDAVENIAPASGLWLMERLEEAGSNYFVYTIRQNRNFIYHHGDLTEAENIVYQELRRSPYRCYLDEDPYSLSDVVYVKVVTDAERAKELLAPLKESLEERGLRAVIRRQAGLEGGVSLYFYAASATQERAMQHLMERLWAEDPNLTVKEMFAGEAHSEQGAIRLMRRLTRAYEPPLISLRREEA
ncbi:MAG: FUSC family protein [Lachnospiraceae bacterium]|nr:FUSC family protein [Lachnospiraceae bacterium]